jgi:intein/homing endonuclease
MLGLMDSQIIHYIDEVKPANWGQSKGGKLSAKSLSKIVNFPSKDDRLAEFVGIMLGDGNVFSKDYQNTTVNCIKIAGNPKTGTSYILDFVKPLLESLFGTKVSVYVNKKGNEIFLTLHGKNIIKFVERIGLPRGNKVKNMPTIPEWVFEDERHLKVCVRGLVDTDGSIYALKPHYPNLLQICFKNKNPRLLADFRIALQKLGFHPSKISWNKVYLTRQAEIDRYVREIGFNNPNHLKRYLEVRARFCRDSGQVFI